MLDAHGDAKGLTLSLDGRAEQGLSMAEAVAVALPEGLAPSGARVYRSPWRLSLELKARVRKGHTYTFGKFVALSREGWGGDARADLALVRQARGNGFARLRADHVAAWHDLWRSDIRIEGDKDYKAHIQLGVTYREMEMYDEALKSLEEANKLSPTNADIIYTIGTIYEAQKDYENAIAVYKEALSFDPLFENAVDALDRLKDKDTSTDKETEGGK